MTAYEMRRKLNYQLKQLNDAYEVAERSLKIENKAYCDLDMTAVTEALDSSNPTEVEYAQQLALINTQKPQIEQMLELSDDDLETAVNELMAA